MKREMQPWIEIAGNSNRIGSIKMAIRKYEPRLKNVVALAISLGKWYPVLGGGRPFGNCGCCVFLSCGVGRCPLDSIEGCCGGLWNKWLHTMIGVEKEKEIARQIYYYIAKRYNRELAAAIKKGLLP